MRPKHLYLVLCIAGTLLPYSQFIPFLREHGFDLRLVLELLFANRISGFFGWDVIVAALVVCVFVVVDGRRYRVRGLWAPILAVLTVGVSLGLPLFLYLRETRLGRSAS